MKSAIRFLLNDEIRELTNFDPSMTVLQYLRLNERLCGTKEGCAEGDCGACTVVLGEVADDQSISYKAVNSCIQFLPTLDGKQLLTVEHLGSTDNLHPIQKALVDFNGSQCGFCTPGFVMSLYALQRSENTVDRQSIDLSLAGNLCRCTGYGSIIAAAKSLGSYAASNPLNDKQTELSDQLNTIKPSEGTALTWQGRWFYTPAHLEELDQLVATNTDACILAGGTDIGLWVTKQLRVLDTLIYLGNVPELKRINTTNDYLEICAAVTYSEAFEALCDAQPKLRPMLERLGATQVRNVGTICGNIANGSPIGDMPPALIVLQSILVIRGSGRCREIPLEDFFIGYGKQALQSGEYVYSVKIPRHQDASVVRVYKLSKRSDQDISTLCGAFSVWLENGIVSNIRICFGGMAGTPARAMSVEGVLIGKPWTEETVTAAMKQMPSDYTPLTDMRGSQRYRMQAAKNLLLKFYAETSDQREDINVFAAGDRY